MIDINKKYYGYVERILKSFINEESSIITKVLCFIIIIVLIPFAVIYWLSLFIENEIKKFKKDIKKF